MNLSRIASLFSLTLLCGCGISDSTLIADLDAGDAEKVCAEFAGYARTVTCTFGTTEVEMEMGMGTEADCVADFEPAPAGCTLTMGDLRSCMDAMDAMTDEEFCAMTEPPAECAAMMSESCSSGT